MADSLILMVLALVVFGPRRLPQIGRQIGKLMYEFRKASNDFKFQMEEELRTAEDADRRKKQEEERARNLALNPPPQTPSVEAQAAIGADDQASVSAQPPAAVDGSAYPAEHPAESAAGPSVSAQDAPQIRYPRISPPSTGEPIAAAKPGVAAAADDAPSEPAANDGAVPVRADGTASPEPSGTETVSQHG